MLTRKINENTFLDDWISWGVASPGFSPVHPCARLAGSHCRAGCTFRMDQLPQPQNCSFSWTARALTQRHSCTSPQPHAQDAGSPRTSAELLQPGGEARGREGSSPSPEARRYLHLPKGLVSKPCLSLAGVFNTLHSAPVWRITRGSGNKTRKWSLKKFPGFWAKLPFLV